MATVRRKCFISYHHDDEGEARDFIDTFDHYHDVFIYRGLGLGIEEDIINSNNPEYVMSEIRRRYLRDSSVTIVLVGACTWARRYVDWEIQASLRHGETVTPNGLLGVELPSVAGRARMPHRLAQNVIRDSMGNDLGFALWKVYPRSIQGLATMIEEAYARRVSHSALIVNPRERFASNLIC